MKYAIIADIHGNLEALQALLGDIKQVINPGSVGQPRDNNPRAAYLIYDLAAGTIELRRLDYDITKARQKMRDAGL
jgi:diadenosine tetraphosphatase ApaH/serine/threonine PP2A family protein phosphatase